jgi:DNA-directed RNA polymerase II subunit RPB1
MTRDDDDLGESKFFDICMKGDGWTPSQILKSLERVKYVRNSLGLTFPLYCGKSLISLMLPPTLNYTKKNDGRKDQPVVKIVKGVMIEGALTKANLGSAHNSLIHVIYKEYGMDKGIDFINNVQFISNQYLLHRSFTVGIKDCVTNISKKTEEIAYKCFIEAKATETSISHDKIRELKICAILDKARDMSQKLAKNALLSTENGADNAFVATVTSGSKGEYFNITQITSMLGQQMHMGKRIHKNFNRGKRTLSCYPKENPTIEQEFESRGFIKHSFLHGLNPQEFIWHAVTGREGCSDTSMKTANSGYVQRKLVKVFEDIQVRYDGTVRGNSFADWVVQWGYGGDGFDRSECSFKDGSIFFCDVENIASRLNNEFELERDGMK